MNFAEFQKQVDQMKEQISVEFQEKIREVRPDLTDAQVEEMDDVRARVDALAESVGPRIAHGLIEMFAKHILANAQLYEIRKILLDFLRDLPESERIPTSV